MRKFKFKLRRNPTPAAKRLPADQLKKMAKSAEIMRKQDLAVARKKRAAAARKAAKAAPYKAAGKKASAKKATTRRKRLTAAERLIRARNSWKIKDRKTLREMRKKWLTLVPSMGGSIAAGKYHNTKGWLIKNPGPSRKRRTSRKLRKNPARRNRRMRMRLRRNPSVASIKSALLAVIPTIGGFMVARMVSKKISPMIPGLSAAGKYGDTAVALALLVGADFATNKVAQLSKYKTGIVAGFALNAVESALRTFLPESVKARIGLSDYVQLSGGMYDRGAVGDYVQIDNGVGEYVVMPDDDSLGYVDVQQDLAGDVYEDLAGTRMDLAGLRAPIPTHRRIGGVPAMSYQAEVPDAQIEDESALYEGMFSGR